MSWGVYGKRTGVAPEGLVGHRLLVQLYEIGSDRMALGFVDATNDVAESTTILGTTNPAHVDATVVEVIPTKTSEPLATLVGQVVSVYDGQVLAKLGKDAKTTLRFIDDRGVPWTIRGYVTPPDGFSGQVVAWTEQYGADEVSVEGATLDEVKAKIRAYVVVHARNLPTLTSKDRVRDDKGPISVEDVHGTQGAFGVWALDNQGPKAQTWYYAARSSAFSSEVVGPALSLSQLQGDVSAYRDDAERASLGLLGDASSRSPLTGMALDRNPVGMALDPEVAKENAATAPPADSSMTTPLLVGAAALGLLLLNRRK